MSDLITGDELLQKTYQKLGEALEQLGRWEEAVEAYQRSIELNGNSAFSYESLGNLLAEKGEFDLAIGMYRTAIRLNPSFHGFHYHLALALIGKKDYQNAIAELLSCIDKNFQHYPSYDLMGDLLIQQGQEAQLIQLYRQGLLAMRHNYTDYQKFIQKISDLGLDEEIVFNQSFLKDLQVISDFWEPHQSIGKRDEWILIELHGCGDAGMWMTGWNLVAAKCLQKLYGYRIAAFVAWGYDHHMKQLLISFGVEKLIISNDDYALTDYQKYQLESFHKMLIAKTLNIY